MDVTPTTKFFAMSFRFQASVWSSAQTFFPRVYVKRPKPAALHLPTLKHALRSILEQETRFKNF